MQNFGGTNKEHYGMLWYFWSGQFGWDGAVSNANTMQTKLLQAPATSDIMKLGFGKRNINKKKLDHYLTGLHAVSELF